MEMDVINEQINRDSLIKDFAHLTGHDPDYFMEDSLELRGTIDREYEGLPLWKKDYQAYEYYALIKNPVLKTKEAELRKLFTEYEHSKTSWIPRVSLEGAIYLRGTVFPLQDLDGSLSLKIDFPFPPTPSALSFGAGGQGENQVTGSFTANNQLLPDLDFVTNEQTLSLNLRQSSEELDDSITELIRTIYTNIEQIEQQRVKMTILRNTQNLLQKRLNILETRYKIGEIKELNILQARVDYYEGEIGIREGVITLLKAERELEKTLGLNLGELTSISKRINIESEISNQGKDKVD
jgi:hypothetical protein